MNKFETTKSFFKSYDPTPNLVADSEVLALYSKIIRKTEYGDDFFGSSIALADAILEDSTSFKKDKDTVSFGAIRFEKAEFGDIDDFFILPSQNKPGQSMVEPHLKAHFSPSTKTSREETKEAMKEASVWLKEASEDYPMVYGCTYKKLASTAVRLFDFENIVNENELRASDDYRKNINLAFVVFSLLNNSAYEIPEIACVSARTDHLAEKWSNYGKLLAARE